MPDQKLEILDYTLDRKVADEVAKKGYYVVVPDYFRGDPLVNLSDVTTWLPKHPVVRFSSLHLLRSQLQSADLERILRSKGV